MNTTYFKFIAQRTAEGKSILVAVIPDDMLGENLPAIVEGQAFLMPAQCLPGHTRKSKSIPIPSRIGQI
jgi:hypothetical protein